MSTLDAILREPLAVLNRIHEGSELRRLVRVMLITIGVCAAAFGAAMGAYRGGIQIVFAAIKVPLAVLLTAALSAPALTALNAAFDRPADLRRDLALVMTSLGLGSLMIAATAPLLLLFERRASDYLYAYHIMILLVVACCVLGGVLAMFLFLRGLARSEKRGAWPTAICMLLIFALVGSQMSWTLRPYLVRPQTSSVPFLRAIDGGFLDSVRQSFDSARGIYR